MTKAITTTGNPTIGIDLGGLTGHGCVLDAAGEVVESVTVPTKPAPLRRRFERCEPTPIAIEAGGPSAWIAELLTELGHDVLANARRLRMIDGNESRSDEVDPEQRARVAPHSSPGFVLAVEDPWRIKRSRDVGAYFGLRPKGRPSGLRDPEMRITRSGDEGMRRLLVPCEQPTLEPFGEDSDPRRWGLELAARGGKAAKKKAVLALARELAVRLHGLWRTGQVDEPLRSSASAAPPTVASA